LLLHGCASTDDEGPASYVVRPEDSLYSIAWRHNLDFRDLARWNGIGTDFHISVGEVLVLGSRGPRGPRPKADAAQPWMWPTDRQGQPRPAAGGGILLSGHLGQAVRAASSGRVVYTGSGLRGYGNLIIIKHGESLLSAYAHNREILVHEGEDVAIGQAIARMGEAESGSAVLYFEIRQNGRPVDPLRYLPKTN